MEIITPGESRATLRADKVAKAKKRKEDAQDLALLLYDIYKESQEGGKVDNGQNHANQNNKAD